MQLTIQENAPISIELQDGNQYIKGYFTKFYNSSDPTTEYPTANYKLRIRPNALDNVLNKNENVKLRYNHDDNFIMGDTTTGLKLSKDQRGGMYSHPFDNSDPEFVRVSKKIEKGIIKGSSFQFMAKTSWHNENGQKILSVDEVESIQDVSPCNDPAIVGTGKPIILSTQAETEIAEMERLHIATETRKRMLDTI